MAVKGESSQTDSVFALPVLEQYLLYAPLHGLAALVDELAAYRMRDHLAHARSANARGLSEIARICFAVDHLGEGGETGGTTWEAGERFLPVDAFKERLDSLRRSDIKGARLPLQVPMEVAA